MEKQKEKIKGDILSTIGSFNPKNLKASVTTLTKEEGTVFLEEMTANGTFQARMVRDKRKDMSYQQQQQPNRGPPAVTIDTSPVTRFDIDDDPGWVDFLFEHGYVVVKSVADQEQIVQAHYKLWIFLESKLGWKREDPNTWDTHSLSAVGMPHTGIIHSGGVGHCDLQWYIRCLPRVQKTFETIWSRLAKDSGCDLVPQDLLTSFDGINVFRPWQRDPSWKTRDGWTHVDQGRKLKGLHCVQGLVTLTDASSTQTGGFVAVPGSHRYHSEIVDSLFTTDENYVRVPLDCDKLPLKLRNKLRFVSVKAGDMILWDSRTVHANIPALETPVETSNEELLRVVSYVCMTPKILASPAVRKARRMAYEESITTGHWPHLMPLGTYGETLFGGDDNDDDDDDEKSRLANETQEIQKLVG